MDNNLTSKEYWGRVWEGKRLPVTANPEFDVRKTLDSVLPKSGKISFIEIGCAIGGWMAYFHKEFGYKVSGIEYVEQAAVMTRKNLELQGVDSEILNEDFFKAEMAAASYDVVFSAGFIEHFDNLEGTVNRMSALAKQYVVTIVPNTYGLNGFLSRTIRPDVFYGHKQIDRALLRELHERTGLKTLFCDYAGGLQFIMPAKKTVFFNKHPYFAGAVNLPFWIFDRISGAFNRYACLCPRTKFLSEKLMYIGEKTQG